MHVKMFKLESSLKAKLYFPGYKRHQETQPHHFRRYVKLFVVFSHHVITAKSSVPVVLKDTITVPWGSWFYTKVSYENPQLALEIICSLGFLLWLLFGCLIFVCLFSIMPAEQRNKWDFKKYFTFKHFIGFI